MNKNMMCWYYELETKHYKHGAENHMCPFIVAAHVLLSLFSMAVLFSGLGPLEHREGQLSAGNCSNGPWIGVPHLQVYSRA